MTTNATADSRLKGALYIILDVSFLVAGAAALAAVGFLTYAAFHLNSENIRKSARIEATGQRIDYLERTPRTGFLSRLPWNDDNGHAIMEFYGGNGNLEMKAFDEGRDGILAGQDDRLEIILKGGKKAACFSAKAINAAGVETAFRADSDPVENANIFGARNYCDEQLKGANSIYQAVRAAE